MHQTSTTDKSGNDWALTDVGYFEVEDDFGNVRSRVAKFTGRHLNQDKVSFAHRGVTTQTVALQVSVKWRCVWYEVKGWSAVVGCGARLIVMRVSVVCCGGREA